MVVIVDTEGVDDVDAGHVAEVVRLAGLHSGNKRAVLAFKKNIALFGLLGISMRLTGLPRDQGDLAQGVIESFDAETVRLLLFIKPI